MHTLGISGSQALTVVWSIEDPIQLSLILCPVFANPADIRRIRMISTVKKGTIEMRRIKSDCESVERGSYMVEERTS